MVWFKDLYNLVVNKKQSTETKNDISSLFFGEGTFTTATPELLSREGYVLNASVYSAINLIVKAIIQMKLIVVSKDDEENEPLDNDLSKLLNNPDPDEYSGQSDWLIELFSYYLLFGNSMIYKVAPDGGNNVGKAQFLKVMSQRTIEIITKMTAYGHTLDRYEFRNGKMPINKDDILLCKTFNPENEVIGMSPLMAGGLSVDLDNEIKRWNVALLQNGLNPTGIYTVVGELSEQQFRRLKKQIDDQSGPKNAGKPKVMEGGMTFQQTGINPKDVDFGRGQTLSKREIASIYNIAPQLIGETESQTFANYEQAILSLHNDCAYPLLYNLVCKLNNWLTPYFGDNLLIKIDSSEVKALKEQQKKDWDKIDKSNEMTINEKRKAKGLDPVDNGDVIVINGQTLDQIITGPTFPTFGKSKLKKIDQKEYFELQQKTITKKEDKAIEESKKIVADYFKFQLKEIDKNMDGITNTSDMMKAVDSVIQQTSPALKEVYNIIYKDIAFDYSLSARKSIRSEFFELINDIEKKDSVTSRTEFQILATFKEEFSNYVDKYFNEIKLPKIIGAIDLETRKMINDIVIFGSKNGDSIQQISNKIKVLYGNDMQEWRAERIARTETLRGMSYTNHESQKKVNPLSKQKWLTTHDDRTRDGVYNHRNVDLANGNIGLDEAFTVSNEKLAFPRDTSLGASAGNVINCRCSVAYIDEEFAEFFT